LIRYALVCHKGHGFESWFQDSIAYDKQAKRGLVTCPHCGSEKVEKAIMAPRVKTAKRSKRTPEPIAANQASEPLAAEAPAPAGANQQVAFMSPQEVELRAKLKELREHLTSNAENVGRKFPEEARRMHYGEVEHRSIYGEASAEDAQELADEGIEFHPLPMLPDERN
jgi:hypothetical protein